MHSSDFPGPSALKQATAHVTNAVACSPQSCSCCVFIDRHALDIREHYERKLERANNLYMELSAIMLQLEMREKELLKYVLSPGPVCYLESVSQQDVWLLCGAATVDMQIF